MQLDLPVSTWSVELHAFPWVLLANRGDGFLLQSGSHYAYVCMCMYVHYTYIYIYMCVCVCVCRVYIYPIPTPEVGDDTKWFFKWSIGSLVKWVKCSPVVRETWVQCQVALPKTLKMELDTSFHNTQQYKVRIKGKGEQSKERSSTPSTLRCRSYRNYWRQLYFAAGWFGFIAYQPL